MDLESSWRWMSGLTLGVGALFLVRHVVQKHGREWKGECPDAIARDSEALELQPLHKNFLMLHFFVRLADWLQGTNMYTLYLSYGVDPGVLFMTGFVTSAVFSSVLGHWVDKYGRKKGCLVYCALEVMIQVLEHVHDVRVLLLGRVLGGISSALLFSAFESWVVSEHRALKLPNGDRSLEAMFSIASTLNGVAAVLAGLVARVAYSWGGEIAPFQVSLALTVGVWVYIYSHWTENKAKAHGDRGGLVHDLRAIMADKQIVAIAIMQALFEGAMFTFVFMWVQTFLTLAELDRTPLEREAVRPVRRPPVELLFSCLMLALAIGGLLFDLLLTSRRFRRHSRWVGAGLFLAASFSMAAVAWLVVTGTDEDGAYVPWVDLGALGSMWRAEAIFGFFCMFEACVGIFDPWIATMRSEYVPEDVSATVMTLARVPLNLLVGLGVHLTENYTLFTVFSVCATMHMGCALVCIAALLNAPARAAVKASAVPEPDAARGPLTRAAAAMAKAESKKRN